MAIIRGKPGQYTGEETARLRRNFLFLAVVMVGVLGFGEGVMLSHLWSIMHPPQWLTTTLQWGGFMGLVVMSWWGWRKLDELETERLKWQRGDRGEKTVGKILAGFPDEFHVINDISTPTGNLDHVVVGPTGVFILDAKNWRGLVQADGKGGLLLNAKRLDKDYVGQLVGRIMGVKEKVCGNAPIGPYFRGLFVFTAARVEAPWGKTGQVHCLREDQLWDYIVENKRGPTLKPTEVKKIADAFWRVAQTDTDFTDKATQVLGHEGASECCGDSNGVD